MNTKSLEWNQIKTELKSKQFNWAITGVAGFIGSNLLEFLLLHNQKVIGVDNFITGKKSNIDEVLKNLSLEQKNNFHFIEEDIRNLDSLKKAFVNVDYVLHQAALGSVPRSIKTPEISHDHNVNGTMNVFLAAIENKVKQVVFASSSSVYGDHPKLPKVESEIGKPLSPYALTKSINEQYAEIFSKTYGLNYIGIRYFNVFGKRQDSESIYAAVIPLWIDQLLKNEQPKIFGDGETSRDFCYIENVVKMNILSALTTDQMALNQIYNCACGKKTTLNEVFQILKNEIALKFPNVKSISPIYTEARSGDIRHSLANISKAETNLAYSPEKFFDSGIKEAITWYIASSLEKK